MAPQIIDLIYPIQGKTLPVDHGYSLYGALSRVCPQLHQSEDAAVHLIRGKYAGNGLIAISSLSRLKLRISADKLPFYLGIAGKTIDIGGHKVRIGVPNPYLLKPAAVLYAHLVTTKNGNDEERFRNEIQRQLNVLNIKGKCTVGKRRTFQVHEKQVVGYSMLVSGLAAEESLLLQEKGLGGRRKMGCGVFAERHEKSDE